MSVRVIAAVCVAAIAAFAGGYALAGPAEEQPAAAAAPKALELPEVEVSAPPAASSDPLPDIIEPPQAPAATQAPPSAPPPSSPPPSNGGGDPIIEG